MNQQKEIPNIPKRDAVGEAAAQLTAIISKQKSLSVERGVVAETLCNEMIKAKRASVSIDGFTFLLQQKEAEDSVKVIAPR